MRRRVLLLAALAALFSAPGALAATARTELMPGVTYTRQVRVIRGQQVLLHVVTAPKPGGLYRLAPELSNGTITGTETVSDMQAGLRRTATVVGVNGDLFNWRLGYPSGIFLRDGVLAARPWSGRSTLGIGVDGILRVDRVGFFGSFTVGEAARRPLGELNRPLERSGTSLFTPAWGSATPRRRGAVDVVISGFAGANPNVDVAAQVVEARRGGGTPIPAGGAVVQATGTRAGGLEEVAVPGAPLTARLTLRPWWEEVADAIGGGPALIRDGRIVLPTTEQFTAAQLAPRHPRTAVGQLADGRILLVAADGRQSWTAGVTLRDLALELRRLGAVTAMAFDAGGSTTLAFEGRVLNTPSDGAERPVSTALMLYYYGVYAPEPSFPVVSPNGDGVADEQRLAYKLVRPSTVSARLVGPGGAVLWQEEGPKQPGTYRLAPDLSASKEGSWRWVISAVDDAGSSSRAERRFAVNNTLGFLRLSDDRLRVAARQRQRLRLSFSIARTARVIVTVEDRVGRAVRTLYNRAAQAVGRLELFWNGRGAGGKPVAAGPYVVRVKARNGVGVAELTGRVVVERPGH